MRRRWRILVIDVILLLPFIFCCLNDLSIFNMTYKIDKQILVSDSKYGAFGDDFSYKELEAIEFILTKLDSVLLGKTDYEEVYGNMCYKISVAGNVCSIFCYDELLGNEPLADVYKIFKYYKNYLLKQHQ